MKRTRSIAIWSFILIPLVILAIYIGETLSAETAALAMGAIVGILFAALGALIIALVREDRSRRARRAAEEARRHQPARETWTDAAWRQWHPSPDAPAPTPPRAAPQQQLPAPTRALTTRKQ